MLSAETLIKRLYSHDVDSSGVLFMRQGIYLRRNYREERTQVSVHAPIRAASDIDKVLMTCSYTGQLILHAGWEEYFTYRAERRIMEAIRNSFTYANHQAGRVLSVWQLVPRNPQPTSSGRSLVSFNTFIESRYPRIT